MNPTVVNAQITDSLSAPTQNDMEAISLQVLKASQAFTKTQEMENNVFQNQLDGTIRMTVNAIQSLIGLCKEAITIETDNTDFQQSLADLKQQAVSNIQNTDGQANKTVTATAEQAPAVNPGGQDLGSLLVHYVGQSYMNAVNAQQQMYITQQAATTMIITTLLSITTSTIAIAVKNAEAEKASV